MAGLPTREERCSTDARHGGAGARRPTDCVLRNLSPRQRPSKKAAGWRSHDQELSPQRFLSSADALAKTGGPGAHEREVNKVFDVIEPFAAQLAPAEAAVSPPGAMLRLIGQALLAQHASRGRVAVAEKPDVLWDRPDLERLYARLVDEYELNERAAF